MDNAKIDRFFDQFLNRIQKAVNDLPEIVGNAAVNHVLDNFEKESYEGKPWPKRKSKKDSGRKLLVKSGRGRRSVRILRTAPHVVTIGSDVLYMRAHNNGEQISRSARSETFVRNRFTKGKRQGRFQRGTSSGQGFTFKAYKYNLPARTFLGNGPQMRKVVQDTVREHLKETLK